MYYQQGDVLIISGAEVPKAAKPSARLRDGKAVLAEGEATGHAHVAEGPGVELYELRDRLVLKAPNGATVTHEEHLPIVIEPGDYTIRQVRVYDHFAPQEDRIRAPLD